MRYKLKEIFELQMGKTPSRHNSSYWNTGEDVYKRQFYMIAIGALISVPLSKKLMDAMYPVMVSNIACGMNLSFTWQMYALIYAGIIITYLVINKLLVRKIYKVGLSDALKNRE